MKSLKELSHEFEELSSYIEQRAKVRRSEHKLIREQLKKSHSELLALLDNGK